MRGQDPGEGSRQPGAGDQHAQSPLARGAAILGDGVRLAMCRPHLEFVRDAARRQLVERALHALTVGFRPDDDPDHRVRHA